MSRVQFKERSFQSVEKWKDLMLRWVQRRIRIVIRRRKITILVTKLYKIIKIGRRQRMDLNL